MSSKQTALMHALLTAVSYLASLIFLMPGTPTGVYGTIILLFPGLVLILWKKPWIGERPRGSQILISACSAVYFGLRFFNRWIPSSKVQALAAIFHMSNAALVGIATVLLFLGFFFVLSMQGLSTYLAKTNEKQQGKADALRCVLAAAVTVLLSQLMVDTYILSMGYLKFLCGIALVLVAVGLLTALCGSIRVSILLGTGFFMFLSTVSAYVYRFRGRLFEPVDVLSIGTAMNVAETYSLWPIPILVLVGWLFWIGVLIWLLQSGSTKTHKLSPRTRAILLLCCLLAAIPLGFYAFNIKMYHWDREGAVINGYVLDFVSKIKEAYVAEPDRYSGEAIQDLEGLYLSETEDVTDQRPPHIIVIMDEAFSDLSVLGDLSTDMEMLPFVSALRQDAVTGYALVSVFGGNTANSEFEFLTGDTMAWLSPNAVPYQQHIKPGTYSMVSYMKSQYHYRCVAMHPFHSSGWNRPEAYANLGFDECLFLEDFHQEKLIRWFVSDQEMFEKLVEVYEAQRETPLFLFGVTMQNHGGYNYRGEEFEPTVSLEGYDREYPDVEQYLSLVNESDKAVEYLISYFSGVEDDVVIVFFGDHQPRLDEDFYDEFRGGSPTSLDDQEKRYLVPFFVWTNFDSEEKQLDLVSLNYLSSYVYEAAGIPLPPYNRFLSDMEEVIPAINANGFYSREEDRYLPFDMASGEEETWLEMYEQLQYNALFDKKHRSEVFFPTADAE